MKIKCSKCNKLIDIEKSISGICYKCRKKELEKNNNELKNN